MLSKIEILGSSSKGNAYVLHFDNGKIIQLDAGIKNLNSDKVDWLFISHHHIDHDKFQKDFDTLKVYDPWGVGKESIPPRTDYLVIEETREVEHKGNCMSFLFTCDKSKIGYITDCGTWNYLLSNYDWKNCDYLFIECNWDYFLIKDGLIKKQNHSDYAFGNEGHMSNLDCLNLLAHLNISKDCKIIFIHKSAQHANWDTTYKMFDSLPNEKYIAKKGDTLYCKSWKVI